MTLDEIKAVVSETSQMLDDWSSLYNMSFTKSLNITGGEPLLRPELYEILAFVKDQSFETYILTNGVLIDKKKAVLLQNLTVKGIQVSIEGPQEIHDSIRGKGSFLSAIKGIRHLIDAGIIVTLNTTVSKVNAKYIMEIIELADTLKVQRFGFSRLVPYGRGRHLLDKMLSREEIVKLYKKIFSLTSTSLEIVTGDPIASQMSEDEPTGENVAMGGCAAGISGITILSDGTITPCRRMPVPIGNVKHDSIREVWVTSSVLKSLRNKSAYRGRCGTCDRWSTCRGCRAIAYAYSKACGNDNILSDDPQCFMH
jgi:radical SAM protein with 4Fe4S-binding SPASM domain